MGKDFIWIWEKVGYGLGKGWVRVQLRVGFWFGEDFR